MSKKLALIVGVIFVLSLSASAWAIVDVPVSEYKKWPNNWGKWGPDDEVGTLNYNGPEQVIAAAKLVKQGKVIKCSWTCAPNSYPLWGARVGIRRYMKNPPSVGDPYEVNSELLARVGITNLDDVRRHLEATMPSGYT